MAKEKSLTDLRGAKRWLREALIRRRQGLPDARRRRLSAAAVSRLIRHPAFRAARNVALFMGFGSEIHTDELVRAAWKAGKRVLLPMTDHGFHRPYFALFRRGDALRRSPFGPLEIDARREAFDFSKIDLVVVPGLAYDRTGHRLGYGGGVYDRILARARRAAHVGLFFAEQELFFVPRASHDRRLDAVVTDRDVLVFTRRFRRKRA